MEADNVPNGSKHIRVYVFADPPYEEIGDRVKLNCTEVYHGIPYDNEPLIALWRGHHPGWSCVYLPQLRLEPLGPAEKEFIPAADWNEKEFIPAADWNIGTATELVVAVFTSANVIFGPSQDFYSKDVEWLFSPLLLPSFSVLVRVPGELAMKYGDQYRPGLFYDRILNVPQQYFETGRRVVRHLEWAYPFANFYWKCHGKNAEGMWWFEAVPLEACPFELPFHFSVIQKKLAVAECVKRVLKRVCT